MSCLYLQRFAQASLAKPLPFTPPKLRRLPKHQIRQNIPLSLSPGTTAAHGWRSSPQHRDGTCLHVANSHCQRFSHMVCGRVVRLLHRLYPTVRELAKSPQMSHSFRPIQIPMVLETATASDMRLGVRGRSSSCRYCHSPRQRSRAALI